MFVFLIFRLMFSILFLVAWRMMLAFISLLMPRMVLLRLSNIWLFSIVRMVLFVVLSVHRLFVSLSSVVLRSDYSFSFVA